MKRSILFPLLLVLVSSVTSFAQSTLVDETDMAIKSIPRKGQRISMQLDSKRVEDSWKKQLDEQFGNKVKSDKGIYTMDGVVIDAVSKTPVRVISKVDAVPTGTTIWWSIDLGNAYLSKDATPVEWKGAEGYLKGFARKLYRDDMAVQVNAAEKSLVQAQDQHNAVIYKGDTFKKDIEKNKQKKTEIQQQLAQNAAELQQLNNQVDMNLKEQEAARADIVNMRVALEAVKDRLNKIE